MKLRNNFIDQNGQRMIFCLNYLIDFIINWALV